MKHIGLRMVQENGIIWEFTVDSEMAEKCHGGDVEALTSGWEKAGATRFKANERFNRKTDPITGVCSYYCYPA